MSEAVRIAVALEAIAALSARQIELSEELVRHQRDALEAAATRARAEAAEAAQWDQRAGEARERARERMKSLTSEQVVERLTQHARMLDAAAAAVRDGQLSLEEAASMAEQSTVMVWG